MNVTFTKKSLLSALLIGFTTLLGAQPTITSLSPTRNALDVAVDANILVTFSQDMNQTEAQQPSKVVIKGSLAGKYSTNSSYNIGTRVLTINPNDNFLPGEVITVSLYYFPNEAYSANSSPTTYSFTVATGGTGQGYFSSSVSFGSMANDAFDMTFGDLDGDGDMDVVARNRYADTFYILRKANGSDSYITPTASETYSVGGGANFRNITLNDMDNDGDLDIIVAVDPGAGNAPFYIYSNNSAASFSLTTAITPAYLSTNDNYYTFAADWNIDGIDDIFTVADNVQGLWPFYQNSIGSYTEGNAKLNGIKGRFALATDLNNDGYPDFAVIKQVGPDSAPTNDSLGIIRSDGAGSFTRQTYNIGSTQPWGMTSGDMDADGWVDLIIHADSLYIFDNDQDGTFTKRTIGKTYSTDNVKAADLDGDGDLDIAILSSSLTFLFNDGSGNFDNSYSVSRGYSGLKSDLGDADGDGDLDVIYAVNGGIYVYKNETVSTPSTAASFSSFTSNWGTQVTLNWSGGNGTNTLIIAKAGSSVDATPSDNTVYNAGDFTLGSEISTGNFVVYNGNLSSAVIKGLSTGTTYHFKIIEFNRAGSATAYQTSVATASVTTNASAGYDLELTGGRALYYDGTAYGSFSESGVSGPFTVEMWIKPDAINTDQVFMIYEDDLILIGLGADNKFYAGHENGGGTRVELQGTSTAAANAWYHVALTGTSGGNLVLYVNGQAEDSAPITTASVSSSGAWYLATNWNEDKYFAGAIDEVRLWTVARTATEIRGTMHRPPTGFATGLKYYWQFQQPVYGGQDSGFDVNRYDKIAAKYMNTYGYSWVSATMPFGDVTVNAASSITTGTTSLGNASLNIAEAFDNPVDVQVTEFETLPVNMPAGYSFAKSDRYFVIELFGDPGEFSVNLTLTLGANAFSSEELADPTLLKLYKRSSTSTGGWALAATGISAENTAGQVVFNGITSFSQFVVTSGDPFYLLSQVADTTVTIDAQYAQDGDPVLLDMGIFPWAEGYEDSTLTLSVTTSNFDGDMYLDAGGDQLYSGDEYEFNASTNVFEYWPYEAGVDEITFTFGATRGSASITVRFNIVELETQLEGTDNQNSWRLMAHPFNTNIGSLMGSLWTQGAPNSDAPSGAANLYTFNTATGSYSAITSNLNTTTLTTGQGFAAYLFADNDPTDGQAPEGGGWPKTLTVTPATPISSSVTLNLANTDIDANETLSGNEGWVLVANPFAYGIGASDLTGAIDNEFTFYPEDEEAPTEYGVSDYVYAWDPVNGAWIEAEYGRIPSYNAVFIRLLRPGISGSITVNQDFKNVDGSSIFGGGGGAVEEIDPEQVAKTVETTVYEMPLKLSHAESALSSTFSISFSNKGLVGIDSRDKFHLRSMATQFAHMYSRVGDQALKLNHLPLKYASELTFPVHLDASVRGTFTITWDPTLLPSGIKATLVEPSTGRTFDLATESTITFEAAGSASKAVAQTGLAGRDLSAVSSSETPQFVLHLTPTATSSEQVRDLPKTIELSQNYPNPFNPSTTIRFGVPNQSNVTLEVFDLLGRRVASLINNEIKAAGRYSVQFDAKAVSSGIYLYRLNVGGSILTKRMTLVK